MYVCLCLLILVWLLIIFECMCLCLSNKIINVCAYLTQRALIIYVTLLCPTLKYLVLSALKTTFPI